MKATVTKEFVGRRDHLTVVETLQVGDTIEGELAEIAVRDKLAKKLPDADEVANDATRTKALEAAKTKLVAVTEAAATAQTALDAATTAADKAAAEKVLAKARKAVDAASKAVQDLA